MNQPSPGGKQTSISREVLRLALPAVLTSLLQTLVFVADRVLLGRYSREALASMQVQGPILWSIWSIFLGLMVGTVPLVARRIGEGRPERAAAIAVSATRSAGVLGVALALLCWLAAPAIVEVVGPPSAELRALSVSYLRIAVASFPMLFIAQTTAFAFHGWGNTRTPLVAGALANVTNIGVGWALIYGVPALGIPELGVRGAAWGTFCAYALEALVLTRALWHGPLRDIREHSTRAGSEAGTALRGASTAFGDLFRLGAPAFAERVATHAGYLGFTAVIARMGELVMAGHQALLTLESICFLSADGFGVAAATIVGQSLGRAQPKQAQRGAMIAMVWCGVVLTVLGTAIWLGAGALLQLFTAPGSDGAELVATGQSAAPLLAAAQPFMACSIVIGQALRGAGDTRSPLVAALIGGLLVRVGLSAWLGLGMGWGLSAVWLASSIDWVVRTLILGAIFLRGRWQRVAV